MPFVDIPLGGRHRSHGLSGVWEDPKGNGRFKVRLNLRQTTLEALGLARGMRCRVQYDGTTNQVQLIAGPDGRAPHWKPRWAAITFPLDHVTLAERRAFIADHHLRGRAMVIALPEWLALPSLQSAAQAAARSRLAARPDLAPPPGSGRR